MARVLFYVQHLLGVGHVRRASLIAEAMAEKGLDVHVVMGGVPVAGISFTDCTCHQLPEARAADTSFSHLVDGAGNPVDEVWKDTRRDALLSIYSELNPDVLLIEQFPFGRRQFRFELLPLLEHAHASETRPHIACSVRDILVTKDDQKKHQQTVSSIRDYFDAVIVHGDPAFVPFGSSFPLSDAFKERIRYSGYVAPPESIGATGAGKGEVIVAAGGGAVGTQMMTLAAHAKTNSTLAHLTWRFLCGPNLPRDVAESIQALNDPGIVIEPNRSDYGALLANCSLSISQGGYNTLMDLVRARCPAIIVPFGRGNEDEQSRRTSILHDRGYVSMIAEQDLSPDALIDAIEQAVSRTVPQERPFNMDGARKTAQFILHDHLFAKP
jgi:predicted glycosyltransferase